VNQSTNGWDAKLAESAVQPGLLFFDLRFWRIAQVLWGMITICAPAQNGNNQTIASADLSKKAKWLTLTLVKLGATFIKLGQFLSVRRDLLPIELAEELSLLQDRVPSFAFAQVQQTIEVELGIAPETIFATFEHEPIASASIGQVHKATLADGRTVAVKVQRPNLAALMYQDLGYMRWFAKIALALRLKGNWQEWLELSDHFGRTLFAEIDYIAEGRNADRLRYALRDRSQILIPRIIWKYTSRKVLTLEFLAGTKIDKVSQLTSMNLDLNGLARELVACYMEQVLKHGFFQADPHAGNLAVSDDSKLIIYDFGMVSEISEEERQAIWGCIDSVIRHDLSSLVDYLMKLGVVKDTAQKELLERALLPLIDYWRGASISNLDFSHLEQDIDQIARQRWLRLPPTLAYLLRTGASLEGIARTLKPDFNFIEAAKPGIRKLAGESMINRLILLTGKFCR